ncbi:hypothetical protein OIU79_013091 [Salix purpurea]|uniref:Tr-type G domain-containing protein n=1 Tax=Salix purpurea TaxID=77065 RepID=A0A9Q0T436_SALPP|nr:hypothetical protein OIU79_013091 [Salix purpurea]
MVEGVLLVVDSVEGPMPQTRFVLKKALEFGHAVVVVVNKIDRPSARPDFVINSTFELFIELNATDEQCDFQSIYASGIKGKAGLSPDDLAEDLGPLFEAIMRCIPGPRIEKDGALQMLATNIEYDEHKGRIAIGRVHAGILQKGMDVRVSVLSFLVASLVSFLFMRSSVGFQPQKWKLVTFVLSVELRTFKLGRQSQIKHPGSHYHQSK